MSINIKKEAIYFMASFLDLFVIGTAKRLTSRCGELPSQLQPSLRLTLQS